MAPILDGTASPYGQPEGWAEDLFAATGARWPFWLALLAAAAYVGGRLV